MKRWMIWIGMAFALTFVCSNRAVAAVDTQGAGTPVSSSPVSSSLSDSVWFDADAGALVPVAVKPETDDSLNRDSRWLPKARRVRQRKTTSSSTTTGGGGTWGSGAGLLGSGLSIGNIFGWILLVAIIAFSVGLLIFALSKTELDLATGSRTKSQQVSRTPDEQTLERMKHLPAELRRTDVNLRTEAERLMKSGLYDQAIILLFGHQLLLLDRVGMLRLNRGKTNRKYVREARSVDPQLASRLLATVTAFERSYFGRHVIGQREFSELWRSNADLEARVERSGEAAA